MLNIPPLFGGGGTKNTAPSLWFFLSEPPRPPAPTPGLHPILLLVFKGKPERTFGGKEWVVGLAARWKKISFGHSVRWFVLNRSPLLGALELSPRHSLGSHRLFEEEI